MIELTCRTYVVCVVVMEELLKFFRSLIVTAHRVLEAAMPIGVRRI
jgi:hypothetical protein